MHVYLDRCMNMQAAQVYKSPSALYHPWSAFLVDDNCDDWLEKLAKRWSYHLSL